jgi:hypothetical protein
MKKTISISAIILAGFFTSCQKNNESIEQATIAKANSNSRTICMTSQPKEPQACQEKFDPVCGCNSVTYTNSCYAQNDGVLRWVGGTCESHGGGYPGDGENR